MKFGASCWPFQWEPPYDEAIRRIARHGFKATELIGWNKDYLRDYYTPDTIKNLKSVLSGEGVAISQFVSTPHDLSSPDKAKRDTAIDHWARAVEVGAELGSPIINMVSAYPFGFRDAEYPRITTKPLVQTFTNKIPKGLNWDQNYQDYVASLKACSKLCAAFGVNLDPSHTFPVGDFPNVSVYRLGKHLLHLHVSDNDGVTNVHWRPGMGKIDWKEMFIALKEVGYDGVVSIELEDVPGTSRGPTSTAPGLFRNPTATDQFVEETVLAMKYLKGICAEVGIKVE